MIKQGLASVNPRPEKQMSHVMGKTCLCHMQTTTAQSSLRIQSFLFAA